MTRKQTDYSRDLLWLLGFARAVVFGVEPAPTGGQGGALRRPRMIEDKADCINTGTGSG